jgi:hypothetical protein
MAETAAVAVAEGAAAGPEVVLGATGEAAAAAADSGGDPGTMEEEDTAAVGGGLGGCEDFKNPTEDYFRILFLFHISRFLLLLQRLCNVFFFSIAAIYLILYCCSFSIVHK